MVHWVLRGTTLGTRGTTLGTKGGTLGTKGYYTTASKRDPVSLLKQKFCEAVPGARGMYERDPSA